VGKRGKVKLFFPLPVLGFKPISGPHFFFCPYLEVVGGAKGVPPLGENQKWADPQKQPLGWLFGGGKKKKTPPQKINWRGGGGGTRQIGKKNPKTFSKGGAHPEGPKAIKKFCHRIFSNPHPFWGQGSPPRPPILKKTPQFFFLFPFLKLFFPHFGETLILKFRKNKNFLVFFFFSKGPYPPRVKFFFFKGERAKKKKKKKGRPCFPTPKFGKKKTKRGGRLFIFLKKKKNTLVKKTFFFFFFFFLLKGSIQLILFAGGPKPI